MENVVDSYTTVFNSSADVLGYMRQKWGDDIIGYCVSAGDSNNTNVRLRFYAVYGEDTTTNPERWLTKGNILISNNFITNMGFVDNGVNVGTVQSAISKTQCGHYTFPADKPEYTEFWFPFLSCVSFLFIVFMIYRIFIKRLLP